MRRPVDLWPGGTTQLNPYSTTKDTTMTKNMNMTTKVDTQKAHDIDEFEPVLSNLTKGWKKPGIPLTLDDGRKASFPMFTIRFTRSGSDQELGYCVLLLDALNKSPYPADGSITFQHRRGPGEPVHVQRAIDPDGKHGYMETAVITDIDGNAFVVAMLAKFGGMPWRLDGYPFFLMEWEK